MRKKIKNSITTRIFVMTLFLLMLMSGITYLMIGLTMPVSYRVETDNHLEREVLQLIDRLQETTYENSSILFDRFLMENKATLFIRLPDNTLIAPPSNVVADNGTDGNIATAKENEKIIISDSQNGALNVSIDLSDAREYVFFFGDSAEEHTLLVAGEAKAVNQVISTLLQILPWIIVSIVCISLLAAFFYSNYITKPIVAISALSQKMSDMELDCHCDESRHDEIGVLAHSLNEMAANLFSTLTQLKTANDSLKQDIDKERELDRQRMMFFSAVSHELKTPITALQGQLEGMLQNYGSYKDRDKYLGKSLDITKSMEHTIQEIVAISRIDTADFILDRREFDFAEQVRETVAQYIDLMEQKELDLDINIADRVIVNADPKLTQKVLSNLLSNAVRYSPAREKICITLFSENGQADFSISNTGVQISEEAIPHIFEAFYRTDHSRNRQTGGSGLGLYLVKRILEQHNAMFYICNFDCGVKFSFVL